MRDPNPIQYQDVSVAIAVFIQNHSTQLKVGLKYQMHGFENKWTFGKCRLERNHQINTGFKLSARLCEIMDENCFATWEKSSVNHS